MALHYRQLISYMSLLCQKLLQRQNCLVRGCKVLSALFNSSLLKIEKFLFSVVKVLWRSMNVFCVAAESMGIDDSKPELFKVCVDVWFEDNQTCNSVIRDWMNEWLHLAINTLQYWIFKWGCSLWCHMHSTGHDKTVVCRESDCCRAKC